MVSSHWYAMFHLRGELVYLYVRNLYEPHEEYGENIIFAYPK